MSLYDKASLVMIPSGYKDDKLYSIKPTTGDGDFTFSRDGSGASPATRVNSAGLIEKGRTNFLLNSIWDGVGTNTAPTSWTNGFTSGNYESAASSTNGNTGIRFYGTSARRYISQAPSFGGIMALSIYVESVTTADEIRYILNQIGGTELFYLEDSSVVANTTSISSGKTYTLVFNTSGTTEIRIGGGVTGTRTYDFTLSVPQLEKGLVRTSYIETTTAAASAGILGDMPRLDYSGGASCPSLLLEPARTNLLTHSEYFSSANYTNSEDTTLTANAATSPEGVQNAYSFIPQSTSNYHRVVNAFSVSFFVDYSVSLFVKANGYDYFTFRTADGTNNNVAFNLTDGSVSYEASGYTAFIESYTNDWYRVGFTRSFASTSPNIYFRFQPTEQTNNSISTFTGDGTSGGYIYGFQFEAGSYPTSYVPSYGSATARAKDFFVMNLISNGITTASQTEASLFVEFEKPNTGENVDLMRWRGSGTLGRGYIYNKGVGFASDWGTSQNFTIGENTKVVWRLNSLSDGVEFLNGTKGSGASGTAWSDIRELRFNAEGSGGVLKIKQVLIFPTALTDAECISLTTL